MRGERIAGGILNQMLRSGAVARQHQRLDKQPR